MAIDMTLAVLWDMTTGDEIRNATSAEVEESRMAALLDGGRGGFDVDGVAVYADDDPTFDADWEIVRGVDAEGEYIAVRDGNGGVWRPDDDARFAIAISDEPERDALLMAYQEPQRGEWRD